MHLNFLFTVCAHPDLQILSTIIFNISNIPNTEPCTQSHEVWMSHYMFFPFLVHSDLCWLDASKTNLFSLRLCQTTFIQTTNLGGVGPTYVPFRCTGHVVTHPPPANIYLQGVLHQQILWNNFTKWLSQIFEVVLGFISQTQKPNILLDGPVDSE